MTRRPASLRVGRLSTGVFLASFSTLLLQLAFTRILSVSFHYHTSFLVVSLAMLGLGWSGVAVGLRPPGPEPASVDRRLANAALLFVPGAVLAALTAFHLPLTLDDSGSNWLRLLAFAAVSLAPFAAGGLVVALALAGEPAHANRLYACDLVGAGLACAAFVPAANVLGPPTTVLLAAAAMALAGAAFLGRAQRARWWLASGVAALLVLAAALNVEHRFFDLRVVKGRDQTPTVAVRWNAFSRVEVSGTPELILTLRRPQSLGYSHTLDPAFRVAEAHLLYDADALTQITRLDREPRDLQHLAFDVASAPYQLRRQGPVLVIGAGGGRDVLTALSLGAGPITAVEVNPLTLELMRGPFREYSGELYAGYPGVTAVHAEGRNFVRRSTERFDVIQASLIDTWAASAAGAYALTENSLYTVEAFLDFLDHLNPDGVLAVSRWYGGQGAPPVEPLRLVSLAGAALRQRGVTDARGQLSVVRTRPELTGAPSLCTVLVRRSPFPADELDRVESWAARMGFTVEYGPGHSSETGFFEAVLGTDRDRFLAGFPFDVRPVTDDMPFFFDRVPILPWLLDRLGLATSPLGRSPLTAGSRMLLVSLGLSGACTLLLLVLPWLWLRRAGLAAVPRRRVTAWTLYFAALGLGFINVELVLLGRLNLFLGYPVYALVVVLFTLLLSSGAGSALAGRWSTPRGWRMALVLVAAVLSLGAVAVPALIRAALGSPEPVRVALAVLAVAPMGLVMGTAFPLGLRRAADDAAGLVPWAWAVNGATSVFGSALTTLLSMSFGFSATLHVGISAYLVAAVLAFRLSGGASFSGSEMP